ncbi:MAG: SLC13/DASS family transporter [Actinomycetia bacterium]|nr:SLC13/DASS family transporter [Actinomycetes bacterium]
MIRLLLTIGAATIAATTLIAFAPGDWTGDQRSLEIVYRDGAPVVYEVDASTRVLPTHVFGSTEISVELGDGFNASNTVEVAVIVEDADYSPGLGDLEVFLVDEMGSVEIVPVLTADDGRFNAARRPPVKAAVVLAVLGIAVVLWITEVVPLFVTSLGIPVVFTVAEVGTASDTLAPFFDPIIVLFFGGFLMAQAMRRVDLDHLLAVTIVDVAGRGPVRLYVALVALAAFMSMWMSNTAAVTVLIPIALAVTKPLESETYRKTVVLGIAYGATIGGVGSAIGTPANPIAITFIERLTGREISFVEWFAFGLPVVVLFLPLMAIYLWHIGNVDVDRSRFGHAAEVAGLQRAEAGGLTWPQMQVILVFATVMTLWLTQTMHGVNTGVIALGGALVLFVLGLLETDDLGHISWPTLLTFGGGLTLGSFMVRTGTSDWVVTRLAGIGEWPQFLAIAVVAVVALGLTTVASNTATAATLIPLAIPLAGLIGAEPVMLVVVIAVASSIDFALVIGTPPTMLAYDTKLFTAREILAKGIPLDLLGLAVVLVAVVPLWVLFGLV